MKSILTLWLMLLVSHPSLPAQSQTEYTRLTSERIGLTMNPQQHNYLMLFTDIEGFKGATFTVHTDSTVGVTIHRSTADTTLTLQTQAARDLAFYTDNFERIYTNEQSYKVDCDLSRIRHLLRPLQRYRFHPDAESASARLLNGGFKVKTNVRVLSSMESSTDPIHSRTSRSLTTMLATTARSRYAPKPTTNTTPQVPIPVTALTLVAPKLCTCSEPITAWRKPSVLSATRTALCGQTP